MSVKEYCSKVEEEPQEICDSVLSLLDGKPIGKTSACEPEVSYQKMKVDSYRYIAEFTDGDAKSRAVENARVVYAEAVAEKDLPVILLIFGLGLELFHHAKLVERAEYHCESLQIWNKNVRNGHIKRLTDADILSSVPRSWNKREYRLHHLLGSVYTRRVKPRCPSW